MISIGIKTISMSDDPDRAALLSKGLSERLREAIEKRIADRGQMLSRKVSVRKDDASLMGVEAPSGFTGRVSQMAVGCAMKETEVYVYFHIVGSRRLPFVEATLKMTREDALELCTYLSGGPSLILFRSVV